MKKLQSVIYNLKLQISRKKNSQFILFLVFIVAGYAFFFSSRAWFPDIGTAKAYSPMDSTITLDNRDFTLKSWTHSRSQGLMEVEIDVTNHNFDGIDSYLFSCRDSKYNPIPVEAVIEDKNLLVVHIKTPENFKELSLRIKVNYGPGTKLYGDMVKFYTNRDQITEVDKIELLTIDGYYAQRLERKISDYQKAKEDLQTSIDTINQQIHEAEEERRTLQAALALQSKEDVQKSQKRISEIDSTISDFKTDILFREESIFDYDDKILEAESKLANYKKKERD